MTCGIGIEQMLQGSQLSGVLKFALDPLQHDPLWLTPRHDS